MNKTKGCLIANFATVPTKARAAVYKRTSAMLSEIITEDREYLSLIQRHGWQGTEEGKHTGNMADEPETKPSS
ncbi:TPA: potassium transporter KefC [Escherichia coli]|nr:potassium transporter KefC [Salmonella enterica subsp. enterica serovar Agona]EBZ1208244.1 potassium transporter KefC [Salmonella enterica subsp. enterica serovar Kentucky]EDJ9260419.1 potassium transporter KefC [Salmonella enterica subsp. enterica serovar Saintpaul]EHM9045464.1 hypothetical protein [Salmonella enterica]EIS9360847.1 hypothetical protein [Escherichia coli]